MARKKGYKNLGYLTCGFTCFVTLLQKRVTFGLHPEPMIRESKTPGRYIYISSKERECNPCNTFLCKTQTNVCAGAHARARARAHVQWGLFFGLQGYKGYIWGLTCGKRCNTNVTQPLKRCYKLEGVRQKWAKRGGLRSIERCSEGLSGRTGCRRMCAKTTPDCSQRSRSRVRMRG